MSATRFGPARRRTYTECLEALHGKGCRGCGAPCSEIRVQLKNGQTDVRFEALSIDHIDPSGGDSLDNLQLLCRSCNSRKEQLQRLGADSRSIYKKIPTASDLDKGSATMMVREQVDFSAGSAAQAANGAYEPAFREFVLNVLEDTLRVKYTNLKRAGAEHAGCSSSAAGNYLDKLCADPLGSYPGGPCEIVWDRRRPVKVRLVQLRVKATQAEDAEFMAKEEAENYG